MVGAEWLSMVAASLLLLMYGVHVWIVQGTCMGCLGYMYGLYRVHVWVVRGTCMGCIGYMYRFGAGLEFFQYLDSTVSSIHYKGFYLLLCNIQVAWPCYTEFYFSFITPEEMGGRSPCFTVAVALSSSSCKNNGSFRRPVLVLFFFYFLSFGCWGERKEFRQCATSLWGLLYVRSCKYLSQI